MLGWFGGSKLEKDTLVSASSLAGTNSFVETSKTTTAATVSAGSKSLLPEKALKILRDGMKDGFKDGYLDLFAKMIDDSMIPELCEWIIKLDDRVKQLNLPFNNMTSNGASMLFKSLKESNSIIFKLDVSNNKIDDSSMKVLGIFLKDNKFLKILFIGNNKISDKGIEILSELVAGNTVLKQLYLVSNKGITDVSTPFLVEIAKKTYLTNIEMKDTSISDERMLEIKELLKTPIEVRDIPGQIKTPKQKLDRHLLSPDNHQSYIEDDMHRIVENQMISVGERMLQMKDDLMADVRIYETTLMIEKFHCKWKSIESSAAKVAFDNIKQKLEVIAIQYEDVDKLEQEMIQNEKSMIKEVLKQKGIERDKIRDKLINDFDEIKISLTKWSDIVHATLNGEEWRSLINARGKIAEIKSNFIYRATSTHVLQLQASSLLDQFQSINESQLSGNWIVDGNEMIHTIMKMMDGMNTVANTVFGTISSFNQLAEKSIIDVEIKLGELIKRMQNIEEEMMNMESELHMLSSSIEDHIVKQNKRKQIEKLEKKVERIDDEIHSIELSMNEIKVDLVKRRKSLTPTEKEKLEQQIVDMEEKTSVLRLEYEDAAEELNNQCNNEDGSCSFPDLVISYNKQPKTSGLTSLSSSSSFSSSSLPSDLIKIPRTLRMKSNRCQLLDRVGDGGFSSVHKIKLRNQLDKYEDVAAFKQFGISANTLNKDEIEMVEKEIELLEHLVHTNIVKVIGAIGDPDAKDINGERMGIGIVMEYCENGSLRSLVNKSANNQQLLNMDLIIHLLFGAAQGLEYLHNHIPHAIIHGDIKSDNILIDKEYNSKLCDFGVSKLTQTTATMGTKEGNMGGTLAYKAPETFVVKMEPLSDVYSFGCVVFEMLTGERPWKEIGNDIGAMITKVLVMKEQHDLSKVRDDAAKELVDLMKRCLDYDKDKRPSMKEVRMELEKLMKNAVIIDVNNESEEYKEVENMLFPGGDKDGSLNRKNYRIVKIEKVKHNFAEGLYIAESKKIASMVLQANASPSASSSDGAIDKVERLLFHGTSRTDPKLILNHPDAFMKDYSREGFYGKGLYFAELARYSTNYYAYNIPNTKQYQILICSVVCGKPKEYELTMDDQTRKLSHKDLGTEYHSIHAGPHQPSRIGPGEDDSCMYIVYKDTQVSARYLITYEDIRPE